MKYKWDKKYLYWGITAFLVVLFSIAFFWILNSWTGIKDFFKLITKVLSPVIYGVVIAYLLNTPLDFFERVIFSKLARKLVKKDEKKRKRVSRALSVLFTTILAIIVVAGILALVLPQLYYSIEKIVLQMDTYVEVVVAWLDSFFSTNPEIEAFLINLVDSLSDTFANWLRLQVLPQTNQLIANITGGVLSVIREIINLAIGIVISVYVLYNKERFSSQGKKLAYGILGPRKTNSLLRGIRFTDKTFGNFITGKLIDSLIIGVLCYIVLAILKMPYPALISVIIGVTNIIPFVGPFIGAIPSAFLILFENPISCLIFIIFIVVLQQFDGNILEPRILGNTVGTSGFWIIVAILFFGGLYGFWGMLLGVPVMVVLHSIVRKISNRQLEKKALSKDTGKYENLVYIDPDTMEYVYDTDTAAPAEPSQPEPDASGSDKEEEDHEEKNP